MTWPEEHVSSSDKRGSVDHRKNGGSGSKKKKIK